MKARAGKKKVVLELGGNAACIVEDTKNEGEVGTIIEKIVHGAFYQTGQSCISVQRLLVRQDHYNEIKVRLVDAVSRLKKGDPKVNNDPHDRSSLSICISIRMRTRSLVP